MSVLHAAAQGMVEQMALSLAGGTLIAACAWLTLRCAPRPSSRARFALWFGVLIAIAVLPSLALLRRSEAAVSAAAPHAWLTIPESWATYIFGFWGLIAGVSLARIAAGLLQVRRVRRTCEEVNMGDLPAAVRESLQRFSARRSVRLCVSDELRVPTAIGFFRPAVVIPRWLLNQLPAAELNQVALHELAHLSRWDDWTNLAQKMLRAAMFFHPAVWWIDQRLSLEREMACDDAVIAATDDRHSYAQCLAMLAEKTMGRRSATLAQAAVHRIQQVTARVIRILEPPSTTPRGAWRYAVTAVSTLAVAAGFGLGAGEPIVGFRAPLSSTIAATAPLRAAAPVIPAAMHTTSTVPVPVRHVEQRRSKVDAARRVRLAAAQQHAVPVSRPESQNVTGKVIPAKAAMSQPQPAPNMVVLTVFNPSPNAPMVQVQIWQWTVYVQAPAAMKPAPRKTT